MNTLLVAIPVWSGDCDQVLANLKRQHERDGESRHPSIICFDDGLPREISGKIIEAAMLCFKSVSCFSYSKLTGDNPWPRPQNYAWQSIAREIDNLYLTEGTPYRGWFMWESDACPLKKGWIDTLSDEYYRAQKPFMGHVVPMRGHMNAVAVYPVNISNYAEKALLVKSSPFDVMLTKEVGLKRIHAVNHLIAHRLKIRGGDPALPLTSDVAKNLVDTTVIIHGYFEPTHTQIKQHQANRREQAMNETSKAMRRRRCEEARGEFAWSKIFTGSGVDVGAGNDPVQLPNCKPFDMQDGDANKLSSYFPRESLDYIHASQSLEHMIDPRAALLDWALCVKKKGHIVATVPDFDIYEHRNWPSRFNPDHKSAWSTWRKSDPKVPLVHTPFFILEMERHGLMCIRHHLCDDNYDYGAPDDVDQTLSPDGPEAFIEMVFKKK